MNVQMSNIVGTAWLMGIFLSLLGFTYTYPLKPGITLRIVRVVLGAIVCVIHLFLCLNTGNMLQVNNVLTGVIGGGILVCDSLAVTMLIEEKINRKSLSAILGVQFLTSTIFLVKLFTLN